MNRVSNGILDFANMAVCSGLLVTAYDAIPKVSNHAQNVCSVSYKDSGGESGSGPRIIAFVSCHGRGDGDCNNDDDSLVDSGYARFPLFVLLNTKVNPVVSISKAAVELFASVFDQLSLLKDQIDINRPLIITGRALGGSVASLFTLWLLDTIYLKTAKTPLCLTFGSPLLGDNALQQAISERPTWISCFLHVISNQDPVPRYLAKGHMPFGAALFISESGCACFEDPQSILEIIKATSFGEFEDSQIFDYGSMLKKLRYNAICQGRKEEVDTCDISDPVQCGITLQLLAIGAIEPENSETSPLIPRIRRNLECFQRGKKNNIDQTKKLNEVKIYMAYMGWYKKISRNQGGYYDCYKTAESKSIKEGKTKEEVVRHQRILNQYWKHMVKEIDRMPKREGATNIRPRVLYAGTHYRWLVEPLDIAVYYRQGKKDYINKGRSQHYKLLEEWEKGSSKPAERHKVSRVTEDSCFWAHVEEALIACRYLTEEIDSSSEEKESRYQSLLEFEAYVMDLIRMHTLSPETFQEGSSFMQWWRDYKKLKGVGYKSELTNFMNNQKVGNDFLVFDEYKRLS
ncbi:hypothetical protein ACET3Z_006071 [Daucus carota]